MAKYIVKRNVPAAVAGCILLLIVAGLFVWGAAITKLRDEPVMLQSSRYGGGGEIGPLDPDLVAGGFLLMGVWFMISAAMHVRYMVTGRALPGFAFNLYRLEGEVRLGPPVCRRCGYSLDGLGISKPCPECGTKRSW